MSILTLSISIIIIAYFAPHGIESANRPLIALFSGFVELKASSLALSLRDRQRPLSLICPMIVRSAVTMASQFLRESAQATPSKRAAASWAASWRKIRAGLHAPRAEITQPRDFRR